MPRLALNLSISCLHLNSWHYRLVPPFPAPSFSLYNWADECSGRRKDRPKVICLVSPVTGLRLQPGSLYQGCSCPSVPACPSGCPKTLQVQRGRLAQTGPNQSRSWQRGGSFFLQPSQAQPCALRNLCRTEHSKENSPAHCLPPSQVRRPLICSGQAWGQRQSLREQPGEGGRQRGGYSLLPFAQCFRCVSFLWGQLLVQGNHAEPHKRR